MDVCHLLLGRTWKFDRYAMYDCRKNTYEIEKDGISYTLTPLKEDDKEQTKKDNVMMVDRKEFIKVDEEENMEIAATTKHGDTMILGMKNGMILEGNDIELKVKDELILQIQGWLKRYVAMRVGEVIHSLLTNRDIGHSSSSRLEVNMNDEEAVKGAPQHMEKVSNKGKEVKGKLQENVDKFE